MTAFLPYFDILNPVGRWANPECSVRSAHGIILHTIPFFLPENDLRRVHGTLILDLCKENNSNCSPGAVIFQFKFNHFSMAFLGKQLEERLLGLIVEMHLVRILCGMTGRELGGIPNNNHGKAKQFDLDFSIWDAGMQNHLPRHFTSVQVYKCLLLLPLLCVSTFRAEIFRVYIYIQMKWLFHLSH